MKPQGEVLRITEVYGETLVSIRFWVGGNRVLLGRAVFGSPTTQRQIAATFFSSRGDAMSRKDAIKKLREQLVRRRDALHRALEGDLSLLRELHQEKTGDVLDAAADTVQDELNSQLIEAESRELASINAAIGRIKHGGYGDCESCGKPIPLTRLRAIPYATDCIACRRKSESQSRSGGAVHWNRVFDNAEVDSF